MKVEFTRDTRAGEADVPFRAGQIVDLPDPSADRWLRRGACVLAAVVDRSKTKPKRVTGEGDGRDE